MVKITNKTAGSRDKNIMLYARIGGAVVFMILTITWITSTLSIRDSSDEKSQQLVNMASNLRSSENDAAKIKKWRKTVAESCQAAQSVEQVQSIQPAQVFKLKPIQAVPAQPRGDAAVVQCNRVLMDFGANIGDTAGKLIDAGLPGCDRQRDLKITLPLPVFDVDNKRFVQPPNNKRNPLVAQFEHLMREQQAKLDTSQDSSMIGPEDYCYYGVEGNPVFTPRLQELEDFVVSIKPRPLKHLHFFTESVGAGTDGMTKLYLDTINTKENFWGSSIFKDHQDVRKSSANATETIAADVMGYTIGTLMRKTLRAFAFDATPAEKQGGHFILKVDIEGGEYPLLDEAVKEGTLCEYVKMGNSADLYIEYHSQRVTGKHELAGSKKAVQDKLTACGVNFRNLGAWWH